MFEIGFSGYDLSNKDNFLIKRPNGSGDYLFLFLAVPFYIHTFEDTIKTEPNACILFPPDEPHHYEAVKCFRNSFFHFSTDKDLFNEYNIPPGIPTYPTNHTAINQYIRDIITESAIKPPHYKKRIDCLVEQILIEVSRELYIDDHEHNNLPLYAKFQSLRMSIINYCEHDWTIEELCKNAHMEKSQFYKYYVDYFHTTPKADIINARIEKAKKLLTKEGLRVCEVAEMCGFKNASHFTRFFRKKCNCSPNEYKQSFNK